MSVFELRHYQLYPHNREFLHERFAQHTSPIFDRLGFEAVAFFEVDTGPGEGDLVYLMKWESVEARAIGWRTFAADQEWARVRAATNERHGPLVARTNSTLLRPTGYSRMA